MGDLASKPFGTTGFSQRPDAGYCRSSALYMVIVRVTTFDRKATKIIIVAVRVARLGDRLLNFQSEPNVSPRNGTGRVL